jgi:hypothetical protein
MTQKRREGRIMAQNYNRPKDEIDHDFVKISANLPAAVVATLREVAQMKGTSMTEVLRHAISLEALLLEKERDGAKIIVEEKDKSKTQLVIT